MQNNVKKIVSMIAGEDKITLITVDGNVIEMKDDKTYDTAKLVKDITPQLNGLSIVTVDLNDYLSVVKALSEPVYQENGIVITHTVNGVEIQGIFYPQNVDVQVQAQADEEPVTIPNVEKMEKHINRAADENSPAIRNFFKRLAPVARDRRHSAEDLMNFVNKCEMPLTHDGKIIGYKRVNQGKEKGTFVDCHSGNIIQRVGSRVWMDIDGVDPSRNKSCSHGLHVANLGYLRGFGGNHTLIVLVDPKDFIAVPHGEDTKCRVCSYDIVGVVTGSTHKVVSGSQVAEDTDFNSMIKNIIEGNYTRPDQMVKVGKKQMEEVREITTEELSDVINPETTTVSANAQSLTKDKVKERGDTKKAIEAAKGTAAHKWLKGPAEVEPAFAALLSGEKSKASIARDAGTSTRTLQRWQEKYDFAGYEASKAEEQDPLIDDQVQEEILENDEALVDITITATGDLRINAIRIIRMHLKWGLKEAKEATEDLPKVIVTSGRLSYHRSFVEALRNEGFTLKVEPTPEAEVVEETPPPAAPAPEPKAEKPLGVKEQGQRLFSGWANTAKETDLREILAFKKKKKKGWSALGFTAAQEKKILTAAKKLD